MPRPRRRTPSSRHTLRLPDSTWGQLEYWRGELDLQDVATVVQLAIGEWLMYRRELAGLAIAARHHPELPQAYALRPFTGASSAPPSPAPAPASTEPPQVRRRPRRG